MSLIPTVDVTAPDAAAVDAALQQAGFLLVTGHGVERSLRAEVRAAARRFFALPTEVKQRYAVRIGGRGWLAPGVESNGNADVFGADSGVGYPAAEALPGSRLVPGVFGTVRVAAALPKGLPADVRAKLDELIAEAKRTGVVQQAIDSKGLKGVSVAPN